MYIKKKFFSQSKVKVFKFLLDNFNISINEAQKWIDKKRVLIGGNPVLRKSLSFKGEIEIILFETASKELKPIFQTNEFLLYDKPSGVLVHPKDRSTEYSITHEVKHSFGKEANITHRLDKETSGLILCSKNKIVERGLKELFETQKIKKSYLALVWGELKEPILVDKPIAKNSNFDEIKLMVYVNSEGKESSTFIKPLYYNNKTDQTLVEVTPKTGRQHQIRVHLHHIGHPIVGDPLYGRSFRDAEDYLEGKLSRDKRIELTGAYRLMLHSQSLEFFYKNRFKILSKMRLFDLR